MRQVRSGAIIRIEGEPFLFQVLQAEDAKGPLPRIALVALNTGMALAPQQVESREFLLSDAVQEVAQL